MGKKDKIKEAPEVVNDEESQEVKLKTVITVAFAEDGRIIHEIQGQKDIPTISGLIKYLGYVEEDLWKEAFGQKESAEGKKD